MNTMAIVEVEEVTIEVCEPSDNAHVIYTARRLAVQAGFDEIKQVLIATAASELSTNILRYALKGTITIKIIQDRNRAAIELIALDKGPGIGNIDQAMQEHFSTGNGLGLGLSSVKRIMDEFTIQSKLNHGTHIVARKWRTNAEN
ncbi:MAG: anti-sigma regulatory factor [Desulfobacterales bacterium]|nr:anti-sigma regulatory factor [Desulfobacterales bacterium]